MSHIIGIDLGTTNSACAVMEGNVPTIIPNAEGERLTPSIVAINPKTGERLVGQLAKRQAIINPTNTVLSIKRFMGHKLDDAEVQNARQTIAYPLVAAENGDLRVTMNGGTYSPPEISAMILQKIKQDAEAYLGETVTQAVITVPAYFNDTQRQATKDAGKIAGLDVLRIVNEPTASSLAYGLRKEEAGLVAIFDLGGGTFDISILDVSDNVFEVRATNGDTFLGGNDWDRRLVEWLLKEFEEETTLRLSDDRQALQRIREAAEQAKIELSSMTQTAINLPFIAADENGPRHLERAITRAQLEALTHDLIECTIEPCRRAFSDAQVQVQDINVVLLVGGMTRMPAIRRRVTEFFERELQQGVNPDEVVALGAAVQAGVLNGEIDDLLLLDVTPLTLSIRTLGGIATPLIRRNTTIPTRRSHICSTAADDQTQVEIEVLQGERPLADENKSLGAFILDGIPPAPRGIPEIEVSFDIDADGILNVTASDKLTGNAQQMEIIPASGLSSEEIARMITEATAYERPDQARHKLIEARNQADTSLQTATAFLRQATGQLLEEDRQLIAQHAEELERAQQLGDIVEIRQKSHALLQLLRQKGEPIFGHNPPKPASRSRIA